MSSLSKRSQSAQSPLYTLTLLFVVWKALLLLLAFCSPGPGYDTSTSLLSQPESGSSLEDSTVTSNTWLLKLIRWDAVYYTQISTRGHVFEQEWAFGIGLSGFVSFIYRTIAPYIPLDRFTTSTIVAITTSHLTHGLSVVTIYNAVIVIFGNSPDRGRATATLSAALHILSPAGIFLSAPCPESLFSFLNTLGFLAYAIGMRSYDHNSNVQGALSTLVSGICLGCATTIRSNGVLSGTIFLHDAVLTGLTILRTSFRPVMIIRLAMLVTGGLFVAAGLVVPQYVAYQNYCRPQIGVPRAWCEDALPSIYTWVQGHYWNVGFLRYWTLSNVPLFLLALPMLLILTYSGLMAWGNAAPKGTGRKVSAAQDDSTTFASRCLIRFATPQAILAVLALTSYHVQIITRLSSGYFVWYCWVAERIINRNTRRAMSDTPVGSEAIVRWMVIYAIVQAGLYASFLPPA